MAVNKNALIRYKTLDKCFSNQYRKYYINDLIEACNEILSDHYAEEMTVSRRQIFIDIDFMKSDAGYEASIQSIKDGRKVYYRYEDLNFSILNKTKTNSFQKILSFQLSVQFFYIKNIFSSIPIIKRFKSNFSSWNKHCF